MRAQIVQRARLLNRHNLSLRLLRGLVRAQRVVRSSIRLLRGLVRAQIVQRASRQRLEPQLVTAWTIIMMTLIMMTHGERTYSLLSICL